MSARKLLFLFISTLSINTIADGKWFPRVHATEGSIKTEEKKAVDKQALLLSEMQIEVLVEANRIAAECDRMALETAKKGTEDPSKYEAYIKKQEELGQSKEIFPNHLKSIFDINANVCSKTINSRSMDHQSFVLDLKHQIQTTKTMLADVLRKVLGWNDISRISDYRLEISGDLTALSSFCAASIKNLDAAIEYKKQNPTLAPAKKQSAFGWLKNKIVGCIHE